MDLRRILGLKKGLCLGKGRNKAKRWFFIHMKGILCLGMSPKALEGFYGVMKGFMHRKESEMHLEDG